MNPSDPPPDPSWLPPELERRAEWLPAEGERPEGMYVSVGGNIGRTTATLRLFGEDLDPEVISGMLGCAPTATHRKGDPITRDGRGVRRQSAWRLESRLEGRYGIDDHVGDLLGRVTSDLAVWKQLERFNPNIFLGLFLSGFNQGDGVTPRTMRLLADRGIRLDMDIYSASND